MTAPLCASLDNAFADRIFYGRVRKNGTERHEPEDVEAARHLCTACPLREACLSEALSLPERHDRYGIRAGLLPAERQALRVEWRVVSKATGEVWMGGPPKRRAPCHSRATSGADRAE